MKLFNMEKNDLPGRFALVDWGTGVEKTMVSEELYLKIWFPA